MANKNQLFNWGLGTFPNIKHGFPGFANRKWMFRVFKKNIGHRIEDKLRSF